MNLIKLKQTDNHYILSIPDTLIERAKKINPCQWDSVNQVWKYPRNISTYDSLMNEFNKDIDEIKITPPVSTIVNQKNTLAEKNRVIASQRKQIKSLESEISEREHEIDRYISTIIGLHEKIDHALNNDNDIENVIRKVAKQCVGKNERCRKIIEEIEFDLTLPIELPKKVINILKTILNTKNKKYDFADLIGEGRKQNLLSPDAIALIHVIRKQRNIFAHNSLNPNTRFMRVILIVAAFSLLSEEIQSDKQL
jgi:hypothetical protein